MANEHVNKVTLGSETLIDITDTTAETSDVASGEVFYAASGARSVGTAAYASAPIANGNADRANAILYGTVDSTSTSTAFTATVVGLTRLVDGTCVMLRNGIVTSASGFTLNVNGLGDKPVYNNLATGNDITPTNPTRDTTIFNINYTMLFVYDSQLVDGGAWICYRGYDANTNTIGYQLRTNNGNKTAADTGYRYRLWFTSADGSKWVPANTSSATNSTSNRSLNTRAIDPFGPIVYRSTNGTCTSGSGIGATGIWQQYNLAVGYSYMASGFVLTFPAPVYLRCTPQTDGSATMNDIVQALPSTNDGKIYVHLGTAYSGTMMELSIEHPVYWHDGTGIRLWTGAEPGGGDAQNVWYAVHNNKIVSMPISVSCPGFQAVDGAVLVVRFKYKNTLTDPAYLKVNDGDPIAVTPLGSSDNAWRYQWLQNTVISFIYTGGVFRPIAKHNATQCYYATTETSADESVKVLTGDEIVVNHGAMVAVRFVNGSTAAPIKFSVYDNVNNVRKNLDIISSSNPLTFAPGETGFFVLTSMGYQFVAKSDPVEIASASTLGGVKVGSGLSIDSAGVLSASGGVSMSTATATLPTSGWNSNSITVSATGVTASNDVIVSPAPASTSAWAAAGIICTAQGAGTLTFTRTSANTAALTANILILG